MYYSLLITFFQVLVLSSCHDPAPSNEVAHFQKTEAILTGADQVETYMPIVEGKAIALLVNHTSTVKGHHLADFLHEQGVDIQAIFAPEHGFRGTADAGEKIEDGTDPKTGVKVISLYGAKRKPNATDLSGIDLVVFDIQDVGARFYTYISTMSLMMEACAEHGVPMLVLDRPNPNGHYVDGPIREDAFASFVGMHPVPIVYGMTIGEYATMVNGEGWLDQGIRCDLQVIPCKNYDRSMVYDLPIKPSPNLPNLRSILLYPSLCFFEGTPLSVGRGTTNQFQLVGHPSLASHYAFTFTPAPHPGAMSPKLNGETCFGRDLSSLAVEDIHEEGRINLSYLLEAFQHFSEKEKFFNASGWIDKLAGTTQLREMVSAGKTEDEIREHWQEDLTAFKAIRAKYLLYP